MLHGHRRALGPLAVRMADSEPAETAAWGITNGYRSVMVAGMDRALTLPAASLSQR